MKLPSREIDRDLPGGGEAVARTPDADEQKGRDQRQLVERVEEKEIERSKSADRAAGEEEETGVKEPLGFFDGGVNQTAQSKTSAARKSMTRLRPSAPSKN